MKDPLPALLAEVDLVFFAGEDLDDLVFFAGEDLDPLPEIVVFFFLGGGTSVEEEVLGLLFLRGGGTAVVAGAALFLDLEAVCVDTLVIGGGVGACAEAAGTLGGLCAVAANEDPASE